MLVFLVAVLENIITVSNLRIFFNAIIFNHFLKPLLLFFVSVHSVLIYNKVNIIVFWAVTVHSYTDLPPSRLRDGSFKHAISKIK